MGQGSVIRFAAGGCSLQIALLRRAYPTADVPFELDAIAARVTAQAGGLHGAVEATLWYEELADLSHLLDDLHNAVGVERREQRRLVTDDAVSILALSFELTTIGHVTANVEVRDPVRDAHLAFSLLADQTYLPIWSKQITAALGLFPPQWQHSTRIMRP